jgi:hypothetical protein
VGCNIDQIIYKHIQSYISRKEMYLGNIGHMADTRKRERILIRKTEGTTYWLYNNVGEYEVDSGGL